MFLVINFIFDQLDRNRKAFSLLKEVELLKNLTPALIQSYQEFYEYCKTKGVEFKNGEKETLKALRANLALQLFGENTFNQIINQVNNSEPSMIGNSSRPIDSISIVISGDLVYLPLEDRIQSYKESDNYGNIETFFRIVWRITSKCFGYWIWFVHHLWNLHGR